MGATDELADAGFDPTQLTEDDLPWRDSIGDPAVLGLDGVEDLVEAFGEIGEHVIVIVGVPVSRIHGRRGAADEDRVRHQCLQTRCRVQHAPQRRAQESGWFIKHRRIVSVLILRTLPAQ
ncbi:MAG: hypothetical protein ACRDRK_22675 [Pseudonocardia sp.]